MRLNNPGLAIHAHRAMHGFMTRDDGKGFSISMLVIAKIMRLLGVDSLHGGSPKAKMEDYGESITIKNVLQGNETKIEKGVPTLGQKWYGIKSVWHTASGGLHPGSLGAVTEELGKDIIIQCGGGVLGHPEGIERGVEAIQEARMLAMTRRKMNAWVKKNPDSALAKATEHWGVE